MKLGCIVLFLASCLITGCSHTDVDPYGWLEDNQSPKTQAWLASQQQATDSYFNQQPEHASLVERQHQLKAYDAIGPLMRCRDTYFLQQKLAGHSQSSLYTRKEGEEAWRLLIDPTALHHTASLSGFVVSPNGRYLAYGLSKAGSDWQEWHIQQLDTGQDLEDVLTGLKFSAPAWDVHSEGLFFIYTDNEAAATQTLYYHKLGSSLSTDTVWYQETNPQMRLFSPDTTNDGRYLLMQIKSNAEDGNGIMCCDLNTAEKMFRVLIPCATSQYHVCGYRKGRFFVIANDEAPNRRVLSIDPHTPSRESWQEHIPENKEASITDVHVIQDKFAVFYLDNVCSKLKIFHEDGHVTFMPSPSKFCSQGSTGYDVAIPENDAHDFFFSSADFLHPPSIYRTNLATGTVELFVAPTIHWHPEDYVVDQVAYTSKDGTSIPMFLCHKKSLSINENTPVLLYGYGGFGVPITPGFDTQRLSWMQMGGIFAVANVRGGGEFGEEWHHAGYRHHKQTVFDDFIAAAEWLIQNGYTHPKKLAIEGRSNGGLLVGACLTQRPDLFGAAIVGVGVLDMLKFHLYTVGWMWTNEYGSPEDPDDATVLKAYSPYHNIRPNVSYPATLVHTGDHDNRVAPQHSYKFAAALQQAQAADRPILLHLYRDAGHGAGKSTEQKAREEADILTFLANELKL